MEVVLRCENDVQVNALTLVDFKMLYVVCLVFHCWCQAVVIREYLSSTKNSLRYPQLKT